MIEVAELTVTPVAAAEPKLTVEPATKPVPVIVTDVPPAATPEVGLTAVTAGGGDVAPVEPVVLVVPVVPVVPEPPVLPVVPVLPV